MGGGGERKENRGGGWSTDSYMPTWKVHIATFSSHAFQCYLLYEDAFHNNVILKRYFLRSSFPLGPLALPLTRALSRFLCSAMRFQWLHELAIQKVYSKFIYPIHSINFYCTFLFNIREEENVSCIIIIVMLMWAVLLHTQSVVCLVFVRAI